MTIITIPTLVTPINDVETAIKTGKYDHCHPAISRISLVKNLENKKVSLVCFGKIVRKKKMDKFLASLGKKICMNAPNYMLGFLQNPNAKTMDELKGKSIVAVENNPSSLFFDDDRKPCFLGIHRLKTNSNDYRYLLLMPDRNKYPGHWAILAEDLNPYVI